MGSLRFILAFAVILAHTGSIFGIRLMGSTVAVQSFFIISGFYMALILNEKYTGERSYYLFITNRFLRIFPAYWVMLTISVVLLYILSSTLPTEAPVTYNYSMFFRFLDIKSQIAIIFGNLFIFGQDLFMFLKINVQNGFFLFTSNSYVVDPPFPPVFSFSFIPQAWSISTELFFYTLAPFLVRRRGRVLLAIIAVSLALRLAIFSQGYTQDIWRFKFFPNELALFLMGALSYKLYKKAGGAERLFKYGLYSFVILLACTAAYQFVPKLLLFEADMRKWIYYAFLILLIPATVTFTAKSKVDRYLGELSYPMYISHYLIVWVWIFLRDDLMQRYTIEAIHPWMLVIILLLSMGLFHAVIHPMERFRQSRVKRPSPAGSGGDRSLER